VKHNVSPLLGNEKIKVVVKCLGILLECSKSRKPAKEAADISGQNFHKLYFLLLK
jgi:hypothetical protein